MSTEKTGENHELRRPKGFQKGNKAAVGNRGGGRPRAPYRERLERYSVESLDLLWRVANETAHPWHDLHGFNAARELARICTPKVTALEPTQGGDTLTFVDIARRMLASPNA